MMKVGVCIHIRKKEDITEKITKVAQQGFDNCQIISWVPSLWTDENAVLIKQELEKNGVTASAFWCGWEGPVVWNPYEGQLTLGLVPAEYRQMRVKNLCDGADFANKIGIKHIVTHMGFIPENPYDPQFKPFCIAVKTVAEHLKQNDQYLLFETGQETPVTMLRCFGEVGMDNLGVNYDTGNLIIYGKANPVDGLDTIGTYVMGVHAKDAVYPSPADLGKKNGKEVVVGTGKVDFEKVLSGLYELGYDGYITIEREISGEQQAKDIRAAKEYLEGIIQKICVK